ncbi:protein Iojap, chloroplastic isoform X2 [Tripterygium wilfordii]|uniref:protein Iojap, chloroplastic isoform X2 n=1 Tax=Tripterygium wilfordii TaxID=458696 RepID=UPI0018F8096B|nr:protein Iojap, chloroplastic isoform X2 [Tripterygium wilfordii]
MTVLATLPVASVSTGARFPCELRHLGPVNQKPHRRPRERFLCSYLNGLQHQRFFWQIPKTWNFGLEQTFALGKEAEDGFLSSTNEDTDEMFDDLFKKYGKVVFKRNDMKLPTDEVDDDAESLSFAVELARVASDVKAADIKVLFVKPLVYWTRFFIIATAFSRPQIDAIRSKIRHLAETKYGRIPNGDTKPNSWTLLDFVRRKACPWNTWEGQKYTLRFVCL